MISVVIPTYNRARLIPRAIESVMRQTFNNWELIIVDDGSTDDTRSVIQRYLNGERIRYVHKKNSGAAESRNVGVNDARFEWITFLDSDDEATPGWLQSFADKIQEGAEIVSCGLLKLDEAGNQTGVVIPKPNKKQTRGQFTNGGVYALRKKVFQAIGGFDPLLRSGQHTELSMRLRDYMILHNLRVTIIPEALVLIHIHKGERIRSDHKAKLDGSFYTYKKHYHGFLKSRDKRSLFEGIIAYNAYLSGKRAMAIRFGYKSFVNKPGRKNFSRFLRYLLGIKPGT